MEHTRSNSNCGHGHQRVGAGSWRQYRQSFDRADGTAALSEHRRTDVGKWNIGFGAYADKQSMFHNQWSEYFQWELDYSRRLADRHHPPVPGQREHYPGSLEHKLSSGLS